MIQSAIDGAKAGDIVRIPAGTYEVDAVNAPIMLRSDMTLDLSGVTLKALPNDQSASKVLWAKDVENVVIKGGTIVGERDGHLVPTPKAGPGFDDDVYAGGWGMGLVITDGSKNVQVLGTIISRCYGDGIYIDWGDSKRGPYGILLDGVAAVSNRRQGMSVICVDSMVIRNSTFSFNGKAPFGTIPGAGIDFECDPYPPPDVQYIKNVVVEGNNKFFDNRGASIGINGEPGVYANIQVKPGNYFDMKTRPIWVAGGLDGHTPWWAFLLNRTLGKTPGYRWWGYPTDWTT